VFVSGEMGFGGDPVFLGRPERNFSTYPVKSTFQLHPGVGSIRWWNAHDLGGTQYLFLCFSIVSTVVVILSAQSASLLSTMKLAGLSAECNY
jgi:hypothetical protein